MFEFQQKHYPDRAADRIAPVWRWRFVESGKRIGVDPPPWMYLSDDEIVAHQGAMPVEPSVDGRILPTGWFVETMIAQPYRGSPASLAVVQHSLRDHALLLSLGQTAQMRKLQLAMGWAEIGALKTYLFVCDFYVDLSSKFPRPIASALAFAVGARFRSLLRRRRRGAFALQSRSISRFGETHDRLWDSTVRELRCAAVRNASYLNWIYVDRPDADYSIIEYHLEGPLRAVLVAMLVAPDETYSYPRGFILELIVPPTDREVVEAALVHAIDMLKAAGAKTITFHLHHPRLEEIVSEFGFIFRGERHQMLVYAENPGDKMGRALLDAENWYLTMGDSDEMSTLAEQAWAGLMTLSLNGR